MILRMKTVLKSRLFEYDVRIWCMEVLSVDLVDSIPIISGKTQAHLQLRIKVKSRNGPEMVELTDRFHRIGKPGKPFHFFNANVSIHGR